MGVVVSSYNRQIKKVQDLENLLRVTTCGGNGSLERSQAEAITKGFTQVLFRYLEGAGHVPGLDAHVTAKEYELCALDPLFRAKTVLKQLTDSWLLPIGDGPTDKIRV